jgi:hypothetical protein
MVSTLMAVAMNEPPPPIKLNAELPPKLSDLVMKLLEKDAGKRVASAGDVIVALQGMEKNLAQRAKTSVLEKSEAFRGIGNATPATPKARPAARPVAPVPGGRGSKGFPSVLIATIVGISVIGILGIGSVAWWLVSPRAAPVNKASTVKGARLPVETVSWDEAKAFCRKLTENERKGGKLRQEEEYRLPREVEWEYACRAGTTTPFHFGATISTDQVNFTSFPNSVLPRSQTPFGNALLETLFPETGPGRPCENVREPVCWLGGQIHGDARVVTSYRVRAVAARDTNSDFTRETEFRGLRSQTEFGNEGTD